MALRPERLAVVSLALALLAACGGSGGSNSTPPPPTTPPPPPPPPPVFDVQYLVSGPSPFALNCEGVAQAGTVFINAEVEPYLAINPRNSQQMVGIWQQDRWSNGSARGLVSAVSNDGGRSWTRRALPFSRCGGGNAGNGGDYTRATDPWVSFGPDGVVHAMSLSTNGTSFQAGSANAMLASRSTDGGATWSNAATLILDGGDFFNDKNAITADPTDARFVYAVWDRLVGTGGGPTYFARSSNGGLTWEPARPIHDPGVRSQTIGNVIAVLPDGTLVNVFNQIDTALNGTRTATVAVIRSTDKGLTWSAPIHVASLLAVGVRDPQTNAVVRDGALLPQIAVGPTGTLFVVWQDSRFSGGIRDGIALSRSDNGGLAWSAPVRVNADASVPAFVPTVHVRADGRIGVTYYDFRSNTADAATLLTDYWLARSDNATTWLENRVGGPFNLAIAPNANGLFLGDYQALGSIGNVFLPFFVQTSATGDLNNRTDVFSAPQVSVVSAVAVAAPAGVRDPRLAPVGFEPSPELRERVHRNLVESLERRLPGWQAEVERRRAAER